jgi:membrane-associated phospholipid phosphatase
MQHINSASSSRVSSSRVRLGAPLRCAALVLPGLCAWLGASVASANEVTDWNTKAATWLEAQPPTEQARSFAIVQVAVHDALNAIERRYAPYVLEAHAPHASPAAAVASAARDTLVALVPARSAEVDAWYAQALGAIADCSAKTRGVEIGRRAAERITASRSSDDTAAALSEPYVDGTEPGAYRATPPDNVVFGAGWGKLPTFVTPDSTAFRPPPPLPLESPAYARDFQEVRSIGVQEGSTRTAEQTTIADFWYESSSTGWMRIANGAVLSHELDLWQSARVLGLVGLAIADGFINGFDAKYHYDYWRPITAIRAADTDNNPATEADPGWSPYCATPPVADYPSTHSVLGAAAAAVLGRVLDDRTPFTADSLTLPGVTRQFESFSQAARENAESRVYCGIHWRSSIDSGLEQGRRVGEHVVEHALEPVRRRR